jgi:hypothetical protein
MKALAPRVEEQRVSMRCSAPGRYVVTHYDRDRRLQD